MKVADIDIIKISDLHFKYAEQDDFELTIKNLIIKQYDQLFLEGQSGAGKSTFLNLITGLTKPSSGEIQILGERLDQMSLRESDQFRADHFGIIFQLFNLIPYLSVLENIMLPCVFSKKRKADVLSRSKTLNAEAIRLCEELDIDSQLQEKPVTQLSIGQQQRVAIARALMGRPEIIIADEPTSALDDDRKQRFIDLLFNECQKYGSTLIFVSHDQSLKTFFKASLSLKPSTIILTEETKVCLSYA